MKTKTALLNFALNPDQSYDVNLQIISQGKLLLEYPAKLPPLTTLFQSWEKYQSYQQQYFGMRDLQQHKEIFTNFSWQTLQSNYQGLIEQFNDSLKSPLFNPVMVKILANIEPNEQMILLIKSDHSYLLRLPWLNWEILSKHDNLELAFCAPKVAAACISGDRNFSRLAQPRVLVVIGQTNGINIEPDLAHIESYLGHGEMMIVKPESVDDLVEVMSVPRGWDVLIFLGHSWSTPDGSNGELSLVNGQSIDVMSLKSALPPTLKIKSAIFNSCDGLGIGQQLGELISQIIVMCDIIPDIVAQQFLEVLLKHLATHQSFDRTWGEEIKQSRQALQNLENIFPSATKLPIVFQQMILKKSIPV